MFGKRGPFPRIAGGLSRRLGGSGLWTPPRGIVAAFPEDFEVGNLDAYSGHVTSWSVIEAAKQEGSYGLRGLPGLAVEVMIYRTDMLTAPGNHYRFYNRVSGWTTSYVHLLYGWQDVDNCYGAGVNVWAVPGALHLQKCVDGSWSTLGENGFSWNINTWFWYDVEWLVDGTHKVTWSGGSDEIDVNDTAHGAGGLGWRVNQLDFGGQNNDFDYLTKVAV